jgi:hypothetical protein
LRVRKNAGVDFESGASASFTTPASGGRSYRINDLRRLLRGIVCGRTIRIFARTQKDAPEILTPARLPARHYVLERESGDFASITCP